MDDITITRHAYKRAHERMGLSKPATLRIARSVFISKTPSDTLGQFSFVEHAKFVFVFKHSTLVTVMHRRDNEEAVSDAKRARKRGAR